MMPVDPLVGRETANECFMRDPGFGLDYKTSALVNKFDLHRTRNMKLVLLSTFFRAPENAKHAPSLPLQYTPLLEFAALSGMRFYDF